MGEELEKEYSTKNKGIISLGAKLWILLLQNVGILFGFSIMLLMSLYGHSCSNI